MADPIGNSVLMRGWATLGDVVAPDNTKIDGGWQVGERPANEYMNWLHLEHTKKINYLLTYGLPDWVSTTTYPIGAIIRNDGVLYRAITENINDVPPSARWAPLVPNSTVDNVGLIRLATNAQSKAGDEPLLAVPPTGLAYVLSDYAKLDSPEFINNPKVPNQAQSDNSTRAANTAHVRTAISDVITLLRNGVGAAYDTMAEIAADLALKMVKSQNLNDVADKPTAFSNIKQSATESATGVSEIATQVETNTGEDDFRYITPLKLRFGFSILLATSGYVVFPTWMGGLVVQWGVTGSIPNESTATVTFPLTFPTACYMVSLTPKYVFVPIAAGGLSAVPWGIVPTPARANFVANNGMTKDVPFYYIAIGK